MQQDGPPRPGAAQYRPDAVSHGQRMANILLTSFDQDA